MKSVAVPTHKRACHACNGSKVDSIDPALPCSTCCSEPEAPSCLHQWRRRLFDGKLIRACQLCDSRGEEYEWRKHWRLHPDYSVTCRMRGLKRRGQSPITKSDPSMSMLDRSSTWKHEETILESPSSMSLNVRRALSKQHEHEEPITKVNVTLCIPEPHQRKPLYQSLASPIAGAA